MKPETKITKIERTDADVDNSRYIIISYDEVVDDEWVIHYVAKKGERVWTEYEAEIEAKRIALETEIEVLQDPIKIQEMIEQKEEEIEALPVIE